MARPQHNQRDRVDRPNQTGRRRAPRRRTRQNPNQPSINRPRHQHHRSTRRVEANTDQRGRNDCTKHAHVLEHSPPGAVSRIVLPALHPLQRRNRAPPHLNLRPPTHSRIPPRRSRRTHQGRRRTPRPRPPWLHDAHLPTPAPRYGSRCHHQVRRPHRGQPVDPSTGPSPANPAIAAAAGRDPGRSAIPADNDKGPETLCFRAFILVAGAGFEPATFGL